MSAVSLSCTLIRDGTEILGGRLSSWSRLSFFPRETFLRLREAVESRESASESESRFEDFCVEGPDFTSESTPLSKTGDVISALESAIRATMNA